MNDSARSASVAAACVPAAPEFRRRLQERVTLHVAKRALTPPLTLSSMTAHAAEVVADLGADAALVPYTTVLLSNALWREVVAAVPFERRVLMLPQCLRRRAICPAPSDEFGLLCAGCGECAVYDLQREAERLGYLVLVAEGTTLVRELLAEGRIDAVVGVSCLDALAKSFPSLSAEAIPGLAVPLLTDGCENTSVDCDEVLELLRLSSSEPWTPELRLERLRAEVSDWFSETSLRPLLCREDTSAERLALDWLARDGKRWRPVLACACARALTEEGEVAVDALRRIGVAVECFHKASLVHDDIEDADDYRYGQPTLHHEHGVPVALNVGDLLIGCGYRLLAELDLPPAMVQAMLRLAADAHARLCLGQGEELAWMRAPYRISVRKMLEIFRWKTAPAFEVGLRMGAVCADRDERLGDLLRRFCDALGIAFQIRDDIDDFDALCEQDGPLRPSLLLALAHERGDDSEREELDRLLVRRMDARSRGAVLRRVVAAHDLLQEAGRLYREQREQAFAVLDPLDHAPLKRLLHRIASRILP